MSRSAHLSFAHQQWGSVLQNEDMAIDATCGNGHDTLVLAKQLFRYKSWGLIGLDIQSEALLHTRTLLEKHITREALSHIQLFQQSHVEFPRSAYQHRVRLIVYNLGYLPKGKKEITTQMLTTLTSFERAKELIMPTGWISMMCYPGHEEGLKEYKALCQVVNSLTPSCWNSYHHSFSTQPTAPTLFLIQKK